MQEIAKVTLGNEMDLILAHRRSMKLAELAGCSLPVQTSFATAISEVSRHIIGQEKSGCLILGVAGEGRDTNIVASLQNGKEEMANASEGLVHAAKLIDRYEIVEKGPETHFDLYCSVGTGLRVDAARIDNWRGLFRNEPPISAYDELKRKNDQLQELTERVQKSEAEYRTLTDTLPLMMFALNADGRLSYANKWLLQYTGHSLESINRAGWDGIVHPDDYAAFRQLLLEAAPGAGALRLQVRLRHRLHHEYLWHQLSLSPFLNEEGTFQHWIAYIVDIHAQRTLEDALRDNSALKEAQAQLVEKQHTLEQYIGELDRSNEELQQFAFVASHDLQEPVRKMVFYSDLLLEKSADQFNERSLAYLSGIRNGARRMRILIRDILLFSQVNRQALNFTDVDLNVIAQDTVQDLELVIRERSAEMTLDPLPTVRGDERMLRQLFGNIMGNALKYSRPGVAPTMHVSCAVKDGIPEVCFADNGIGFDEKYLPQVFTLFQRLHGKEQYEGTGLGLAICRKIAELHGGNIWAHSQPGHGAQFFVSFPAQAPAL